MPKPPDKKPDTVPTVWLPMLVCPACQSEEIENNGSHTLASGTRCRYYTCGRCNVRFKAMLVPPGLKPVALPPPENINLSRLPYSGRPEKGG
jgi:hypothetical protein